MQVTKVLVAPVPPRESIKPAIGDVAEAAALVSAVQSLSNKRSLLS